MARDPLESACVARSRGLQLEAALDRVTAAMTATDQPRHLLTPAAIAGLLRRVVLDADERRRADRSADLPCPRPRQASAPLSRDLAAAVLRQAEEAEAALAAGLVSSLGEVPMSAALAEHLIAATRIELPPEGLPVDTAAAEARAYAQMGRAGLISRDLRRNDLALGRAGLDHLADEAGVEVDARDGNLAARAAMRALAEVATENAAREHGIYTEGDTGGATGISAPPPGLPALLTEPPAGSPSPGAFELPAAKPPASELLDEYLARRASRSRPVLHHTNAQDRRSIEFFIEICGDRPLAAYGRGDFTLFLDTMRRLPTRYGKSPRDRGRSVADLIAEAERSCAARIGDKTAKRHGSAIAGFLKFGADRGLTTISALRDTVEEHSFHLGNPREAREAWTVEELRLLFASPVWTGCHPFFRTQPGPQVIRDAKFWLPLLALFHGNRLEEFAELKRKDVICKAGVHGLRVTDEHRRLKTAAAKRDIPLHPELIRIGFLDYVATIAQAPDDPLFPDLEPQEPDRKRGPRLTRWFVEYRKAIGVYREGVASHSFRHVARTRIAGAIRTADEKRHVAFIFGHELGTSEGDKRYDKGPPLDEMARTLALLAYPELELRHLDREGS